MQSGFLAVQKVVVTLKRKVYCGKSEKRPALGTKSGGSGVFSLFPPRVAQCLALQGCRNFLRCRKSAFEVMTFYY